MIIDTDDLSDDEKLELAKNIFGDDGGINEILELRGDAILDRIEPVPRTITTEQYGDSPAAALGRAYKIRDQIESHTDLNVECNLTGKEWIFPSTRFYEIEITIEE